MKFTSIQQIILFVIVIDFVDLGIQLLIFLKIFHNSIQINAKLFAIQMRLLTAT